MPTPYPPSFIFNVAPDVVVTIVLTLIFFIIIGLSVMVFHLQRALRKLTHPAYEHALAEARRKADELISGAEKEAHSIRARAEASASQMLATRKGEAEKLEAEYSQEFKDTVAHVKDLLEKQVAEARRAYGEIAETLKRRGVSADAALASETESMKQVLLREREGVQKTFAELAQQAQEHHQALREETKRAVSETLAKEIASAREAIVAYEKERFALLDRQIVGLVEETARIALNKSFSASEHADIVLASLEEAKKQGIFL